MTLLRGLLIGPDVLLLDEPTAALDQKAGNAVITVIKEWLQEPAERGVVLVSHNGSGEKLQPASILYLGDRQ